MLTSIPNHLEMNTNSVQSLTRKALAFGVLSLAAEAQLNRWVAQGELSSRDWFLVAVLRDSIKEGRVCRENIARDSRFQR